MDSPTPFNEGINADISKLPEKDKQELAVFLRNETQKGRIQQSVHNLTDICWKKCITGSIRGGKLERNEEGCMQNCVERFLDGNWAVIRHLEAMRN